MCCKKISSVINSIYSVQLLASYSCLYLSKVLENEILIKILKYQNLSNSNFVNTISAPLEQGMHNKRKILCTLNLQ